MTTTIGEVQVLGHVNARVSGGDWLHMPGRRARELIARLATCPKAGITREQVCGTLWPERTELNARKALNTELWRLRSSIKDAGGDPDVWVVSDARTVRLDRDAGVKVDAVEFDALARASANADVASLTESINLYRGEFAADLDSDWVQNERRAFKQQFVKLLTHTVHALIRIQSYRQAVELAERLVREEPFDESAHRALLLVYVRRGERANAVNHFRELERRWRLELGIAPSEETRAVLNDATVERQFSIAPDTSTDSAGIATARNTLAALHNKISHLRALSEELLSEVQQLEDFISSP